MVESKPIEDIFHQTTLWAYIKKLKLEYEFHEIAQMFPLLEQEELNKLAEDIKKNGLLQPIILYEGKILDGRNRYLACNEINIKPRFITGNFKNKEEAEDYVISENLHRRHLNKDQLAVIFAQILLPLYEERARKRQLEGKKIEDDLVPQIGHKVEKGKSRQILAKKVKVGKNKIQKAKKIVEIAKEDPEIEKRLKEIKKGNATIDNVYAQIQKKENPKEIPKLPEDRYDVIYADPPWKYEGGTNPTRIIENQYPTMDTKDICNLKIPSANNSILFLWVVNPKLEEGLQVINAWGFEYKTNMVWVKDKIGMGYYARGRHELLLIATKGSPGAPEPENRPDSVIEFPRTEHSKKPELVYELIEKMYLGHKYLELFARNKRDKWTSWGDEI